MTGERIMIVDDNKIFLDELAEILRLCGYAPEKVSDGAHALLLARRMNPDAILLDLRMNGKNGFAVAQNLKNSRLTASIPIIAMSGYFPIENEYSLLDMRYMDGRIKRPFSIADLITEIETVLKKKASRDPQPAANV